jgi:CubicO group peptidase (beta-lactamase class C family)
MKLSALSPRRGITAWLLLLLAPLGCAAGPDIKADWETRSQFERALDRLTGDEDGPPGITLLVSQRGKRAYGRSFGTLGDVRRSPMKDDAAFQWWSVTKVVTAVAVLQLAERGKLSLDAPVATYVPAFRPRAHRKGDPLPTVRQLLNHSSGLDDLGMEILSWVRVEGEPRKDQRQLLERGLKLRPDLETTPGTAARYTNLGYLALAVLIERVSGQSYEDYVSANILGPLGMTRTGFAYTEPVARVEAIGTHPRDFMGWLAFAFLVDEEKLVSRRDDERHYFQRVFSYQLGATGLIGPATDLLKLGECLVQDGERDGVRILGSEHVRIMTTKTLDAGRDSAVSGRPFAFGAPWFIDDGDAGQRLTHAGAGMGYVAYFELRPRTKTVLVVMGNGTYLDGAWGEKIADGAARFAAEP